MRIGLLAALLCLASPSWADDHEPRQLPARVIDVHLHSYPEDMQIPPVPYGGADTEGADAPMPKTGAEHREATLAAMRRNNVVLGLVSMATSGGDQFENAALWSSSTDPSILIGGNSDVVLGDYSLEQLATLHQSGQLFHLGELGLQYRGHTLDEERFAPYLAIAEERGIPVAIHTGLAPPEQARGSAPSFRIDAGRPLHLEEVLIRYPKLKLWIMHSGFPWRDETLAITQQFTNVYVDMSPLIWMMPQDNFDEWMKWMLDNGLGKRILFDTDQMLWPQAINAAVAKIENSAVLTREQKDDIFYNNAVRFFGADNLPLPE